MKPLLTIVIFCNILCIISATSYDHTDVFKKYSHSLNKDNVFYDNRTFGFILDKYKCLEEYGYKKVGGYLNYLKYIVMVC